MTVYHIPEANYYIETFHYTESEIEAEDWRDDDGDLYQAGWYYAWCMPGCLPDSYHQGPFDTEVECIEDAESSCS